MRLEKKIAELGICCVYQLIRTTASFKAREMHRDLGISLRHVRTLRAALRCGQLRCSGRSTCSERLQQLLQERSDEYPDSSVGTSSEAVSPARDNDG